MRRLWNWLVDLVLGKEHVMTTQVLAPRRFDLEMSEGFYAVVGAVERRRRGRRWGAVQDEYVAKFEAPQGIPSLTEKGEDVHVGTELEMPLGIGSESVAFRALRLWQLTITAERLRRGGFGAAHRGRRGAGAHPGASRRLPGEDRR